MRIIETLSDLLFFRPFPVGLLTWLALLAVTEGVVLSLVALLGFWSWKL